MLRFAAAVLGLAAVAVGCALVAQNAPPGPLVTIETRGGECPAGACKSLVLIERDGRVHRLAPDVADMARVEPHVVAAIDAAIRATDFPALRSRPFTGECPVNFDGQELIYTFTTPSGSERLASCEVELDPDHPLLVAVDAALGGGPD